jgi:glycyl-tRNA synthetase beta chain
MTDFLLELRSEEIPARMQAKARDDLARLFAAELAKAGLSASETTTYATPRRLALIARDLPDATEAVSEEVKGPKASAPPQALEGFLRKTGLTRDQLVDRNGVLFAVTQKPGRATADVLAEAILAIIRAFPWPKSMRWGPASTSMESLRWVRPLQCIVALFGDAIVPVEIAGIESGAATLGHRFHHPGIITNGGAHDYVEKLRACHVIVDQDERAALIRDRAQALAAEAGLELVEDEGLVVENAGLTEWPVPLLGRFDETFLEVPLEVIQLTARVNQKYFVCRSADGALANAFVCTANIDATDGGAKIVDGNRKVLAARLSDARFFYETDLKVPLEEQAKKLEKIVFHEKLGTVADKVERVAKLARWLVEEGIILPGTGRGTSEAGRGGSVASGATGSAPPPPPLRGGPPPRSGEELATLAERAARLCKADLVTGMVGEFPELQGLIGGHCAQAQGEPREVWEAVRDHYKPVGQGDAVPTAPVTLAVSLADKLDTLFGFFAALEKPSGSRDPFALRRAAISCLRILTETNLRLSLNATLGAWLTDIASRGMTESFMHQSTREDRLRHDGTAELFDLRSFGYARRVVEENVAEKLYPVEHYVFQRVSVDAHGWHDQEIAFVLDDIELGRRYSEADHVSQWPVFDSFNNQRSALIDFFADRLKVQQREAGVRHDLIDAVFALGGEDDLVRLLARVRALQAFVGTEDGANLLAGYKRAANILKKEGYGGPASVTPAQAGVSQAEETPASAGVTHDPKTLSYTPEPGESALIAALDSAEPAAASAVAREDFEGAMAALASLRAPIDAFFETVTVNDPDADKRAARLALLARVRAAVHTVADFSKIEG